MSMDTAGHKPAISPGRRTTAQLLAAAAKDTDAVSVFNCGSCAADTNNAILVVKGRENVDYLVAVAKRQGMLTDKPVETAA